MLEFGRVMAQSREVMLVLGLYTSLKQSKILSLLNAFSVKSTYFS